MTMLARLTVIISTLNEGIFAISNMLQTQRLEIRYLVIFQNLKHLPVPDALMRSDVDVVQMEIKGLSKSRNMGLSNCKTKYALIADDDVRFMDHSFDTAIAAFEKTGADMVTFKIKTPPGSPEYKEYSTVPLDLSQSGHHYISSIEMALNIESIRAQQLTFDERFGLGSEIPFGEEQIFLSDCLNKGLKCHYVPEYLVCHPYESSVKSMDQGRKWHYALAAVHTRAGIPVYYFHWKSYILNPKLALYDLYKLFGSKSITNKGKRYGG